jgi:nitrogen fixation protein NifZ
MTHSGKDNSSRGALVAERCRLPLSLLPTSGRGPLVSGRWVRANRPLRNDGTYPHRDVGEVLVSEGDVGYVLEVVEFCGEAYYTVEFAARSVVVGTRLQDLRIA